MTLDKLRDYLIAKPQAVAVSVGLDESVCFTPADGHQFLVMIDTKSDVGTVNLDDGDRAISQADNIANSQL